MFLDYLTRVCGFNSYDRVLLFDFQEIISDDLIFIIKERYKYQLVYYEDVEEFRYLFESEIKKNNDKYLVIAKTDIYIPYDVRQAFHCQEISYNTLFPKFNSYVLENSFIFDIDLLYIGHENLYTRLDSEGETKQFLLDDFYNMENIKEYSEELINQIKILLNDEQDHITWMKISLLYAKLNYIEYKVDGGTSNEEMINEIQNKFKQFILNKYSSLSSLSSFNGPVLLSKGMNYIFTNSQKPAIIVMDGMSIGDWLIISEELHDIQYKYNSTYAIIPTITSISRQCLLSSKFPIEIDKPFNLTNEKNLFIDNCIENGYKKEEVNYYRGYDFDIGYRDKCICVIINDIDDLVHSQKQGNLGMNNDVKLLSKSGNISKLIKRLYNQGFDVFITSDHGHKETITIGTPRGTGIEVETKSKRTIIMKDFGDYEKIKEEFGMIEYPPYYLPKDFKYLVCEHDKSLGIGENTIISHGGISIEEVIVPFIKIEGVNI